MPRVPIAELGARSFSNSMIPNPQSTKQSSFTFLDNALNNEDIPMTPRGKSKKNMK
jgi:hypothetical protein